MIREEDDESTHIWRDETKINLTARDPKHTTSSTKHGGGSVMLLYTSSSVCRSDRANSRGTRGRAVLLTHEVQSENVRQWSAWIWSHSKTLHLNQKTKKQDVAFKNLPEKQKKTRKESFLINSEKPSEWFDTFSSCFWLCTFCWKVRTGNKAASFLRAAARATELHFNHRADFQQWHLISGVANEPRTIISSLKKKKWTN